MADFDKYFHIDSSSTDLSFGGPYKKIKNIWFFDLLIAKIEIQYTGTGWGDYQFQPLTEIAKRMSVGNNKNFGTVAYHVRKELKRVFIGDFGYVKQ